MRRFNDIEYVSNAKDYDTEITKLYKPKDGKVEIT